MQIGKTHILPDPPECLTLQVKCLAIQWAAVTGNPLKARVPVAGIAFSKTSPPTSLFKFIGFQIDGPYNYRIRRTGSRDLCQAGRKPVQEVILLVGISFCQGFDTVFCSVFRHGFKTRQGHGMHFDNILKDVVHSYQTDSTAWKAPPLIGRGVTGHIDHDIHPGMREVFEMVSVFDAVHRTGVDMTIIPFNGLDRDLLPFF